MIFFWLWLNLAASAASLVPLRDLVRDEQADAALLRADVDLRLQLLNEGEEVENLRLLLLRAWFEARAQHFSEARATLGFARKTLEFAPKQSPLKRTQRNYLKFLSHVELTAFDIDHLEHSGSEP